jgi:hypothetical protein
MIEEWFGGWVIPNGFGGTLNIVLIHFYVMSVLIFICKYKKDAYIYCFFLFYLIFRI